MPIAFHESRSNPTPANKLAVNTSVILSHSIWLLVFGIEIARSLNPISQVLMIPDICRHEHVKTKPSLDEET